MAATQPIDIRDMAIVHQTFSTVCAEAARLVRANPAPSAARVTFLADHIDFTIAVLHVHHAGEDELLYPKLIERVPAQAQTTEEVEHEHQVIATALDSAAAASKAWRAQPSASTGEALAATLDELTAASVRHMDDEEEKVVPLAAVTLTQDEWNAIGHHSFGQIPEDKRLLAAGMLLDPLDDADRAYMESGMPPAVLDGPWKEYAATLRNGT